MLKEFARQWHRFYEEITENASIDYLEIEWDKQKVIYYTSFQKYDSFEGPRKVQKKREQFLNAQKETISTIWEI